MEIIDISWPISSAMTTYKDKQDVLVQPVKEFVKDGAREFRLSCGLHTGTHVDAPAHFLASGANLDQFNLSQLIAPCTVYDLTHVVDCITLLDVQQLDLTNCRLPLFKTSNSFNLPDIGFDYNFVYLSGEAANYLATKNLLAVGIDGLGIERNQPGHETHKFLFAANTLIIEGLRLAQVMAGSYQLICLPLSIANVDSAPARAILVKLGHDACSNPFGLGCTGH